MAAFARKRTSLAWRDGMVTRRKGEVTARMNEHQCPHIVELAHPDEGFGRALIEAMQLFHEERGIAIRRGAASSPLHSIAVKSSGLRTRRRKSSSLTRNRRSGTGGQQVGSCSCLQISDRLGMGGTARFCEFLRPCALSHSARPVRGLTAARVNLARPLWACSTWRNEDEDLIGVVQAGRCRW